MTRTIGDPDLQPVPDPEYGRATLSPITSSITGLLDEHAHNTLRPALDDLDAWIAQLETVLAGLKRLRKSRGSLAALLVSKPPVDRAPPDS